VAYVVVFYDNFLVVSRDGAIQDEILRSFLSNARSVGAVIKRPMGCGEEKQHPREISLEKEDLGRIGIMTSNDSMDFLGVRFIRTNHELRWGHIPKNQERWKKLGHPQTRREVFQRIGVLIWDRTVALESMLAIADVLDLMGEVQPQSVDGWDEVVHLTSEMQARIALAVGEVARREYSVKSRDKDIPITRWFATDASDWGCAWMEFLEDGTVVRSASRQFAPEEKMPPIHEREMMPVMEATMEKPEGERWAIAIDNSAVVSAIRHQYSKSLGLRVFLGRMKGVRCDTGITAIQIPSRMNPSDEPTRGKAWGQEKVHACVKWMKAHCDTPTDIL
jgi:hypothetical protein